MGFPADVHSSSVLGDIGDTVFTKILGAQFCGLHMDAQVCPHTEREKHSFANSCTSTEPFVHPSISRAASAFLKQLFLLQLQTLASDPISVEFLAVT